MGVATKGRNGKDAGAAMLRELYDKGDLAAVRREGTQRDRDGKLSAQGYTILGSAAAQLAEHDDAIEYLQKALLLQPGHYAAMNSLGITFDKVGRADEAIEMFEKALEVKEDFPEAWNSLGVALRYRGDIDRAVECYRNSIRHDPGQANAYFNLSAIHKFRPEDTEPAAMNKLLGRKGLQEASLIQLHFALAKANDDLDDLDTAFVHWRQGNAHRRKELRYNPVNDRNLFAWIHKSFAEPIESNAKVSEVRPIFIVGMPRSGTTLTERILSAHPDVHAAGEVDWISQSVTQIIRSLGREKRGLAAKDFQRLRKAYLAKAKAAAGGKPVIIDKMPINFRWIGFIAAAFPEARIINPVRDPMAVLWSNYKHWFVGEGNAFAYDFDDLAQYHALYQGLMAHWHRVYPDRLLSMSYEGLTNRPEPMVRQLLKHSRLSFDPACLDPQNATAESRTASASQVRRKIYRGSSAEWKRYEAHLEPLKAALIREQAKTGQGGATSTPP